MACNSWHVTVGSNSNAACCLTAGNVPRYLLPLSLLLPPMSNFGYGKLPKQVCTCSSASCDVELCLVLTIILFLLVSGEPGVSTARVTARCCTRSCGLAGWRRRGHATLGCADTWAVCCWSFAEGASNNKYINKSCECAAESTEILFSALYCLAARCGCVAAHVSFSGCSRHWELLLRQPKGDSCWWFGYADGKIYSP